jgi:hypothetical protein
MDWSHLPSYFFGGMFLCNAIPHLACEGLSSSTVNVLWGTFNLAVAYILICRVGDFDLHAAAHVVALGLGFLLIGLFCARHFGRFHGGNSPEQ